MNEAIPLETVLKIEIRLWELRFTRLDLTDYDIQRVVSSEFPGNDACPGMGLCKSMRGGCW